MSPPGAVFGLALMGGGTDVDKAFRWLCGTGSGGGFLILRARGDDSYNLYVRDCVPQIPLPL
jgi:hypothetical protein